MRLEKYMTFQLFLVNKREIQLHIAIKPFREIFLPFSDKQG
jgi:hypothetical protein